MSPPVLLMIDLRCIFSLLFLLYFSNQEKQRGKKRIKGMQKSYKLLLNYFPFHTKQKMLSILQANQTPTCEI